MWNRARWLEDPRLLQAMGPEIPTNPKDRSKMDFSCIGAESTVLGWMPVVEEEKEEEEAEEEWLGLHES